MIALKAHFDGKVIVPDEPIHLPPGQALVVHVQPVPAPASETTKPESFLEWVAKHRIEDDNLPADLAYQHDYYLYGTSKEPESGS